ncbi:fatty acid--CoA ligase family protein [Brevibacillus humidisoli]|uniref:class I adenylate-forming enzyme family protein n=1 Tax=Brevibacillus humidisoli TaxID=2895522 RepID=UPI001E3ABC16|nr:fatty acid--CoA ligase family protein [Brevibacillus humidisoli]UFJ42404.1 fatty acid--CoA ligase family protein [Brevibacillus humidisoli]
MDTARFFSTLQRYDGLCLIDPMSGERTYQQIIRLAEENAASLRRLGLAGNSGQQAVAIDIGLGWRFVPVLLAALLQQVTIVPIDQSSSVRAKQIAEAIKPALIFDRSNVDSEGRILLSRIPVLSIRFRSDLEEIALILYTSGTSGRPKGVMLSYDNIWSNVADIQAYSQFRETDRLLIVRPLTHSSAITGELLTGLLAGSSICVKEPGSSPLSSLRLISRLGISVLGATPTLTARLAHFSDRYDMSTLRRLIASGESPLPVQISRIRKSFPQAELWHAYGLTEASPRVSCLTQSLSEQNYRCVGRPLRQVSIRIVDRCGHPLPDGTEGELLVAGPNLMKGYYNDPRATEEKLIDGWLHTADRASMVDGLLYIHGRTDHLLVRAGMNIYPQEIEGLLLSHPGVKEALVFGTAEGNHGHKIHAWVVADQLISEKELFAHLAAAADEPRLWPDVIQIKSQLAKTASGKLIRP